MAVNQVADVYTADMQVGEAPNHRKDAEDET